MTAEPISKAMAIPQTPSASRSVAGRAAPGGSGLPPLTPSRVRPPAPMRHVIERPRLVDRVSAALEDAPLTLIVAPAGYGKTVVAAAWTKQQEFRGAVAWLTLSDRDGTPSVFWSHVLAALSSVDSSVFDIASPLAAGTVDVDDLGEFLLAREPIVLVLDAAERVQSRAVFAELAGLLEAARGRLRIVMTARAEPPMPLHKYRLEETVAEIRVDELSFTDPEQAAVLKAHAVSGLSRLATAALDELEGWPAGVRMVALGLQHGEPASRLGEALAEYLDAEVLDGLVDADRDLLLRLSVVDDLPPNLALSLTHRLDADDRLKRMSASNTFVLTVPGQAGYRIHPVLRRVLATQLAQREPEAVTELHERAADWFAAQGELRSAVEHAVAVGDWERAAGFVLEGPGVVDLVQMSQAGIRLATCLASMPDLDIADVQLIHAAVAVGQGRSASARSALARYEHPDRNRRAVRTVVAERTSRERLLAAAVVRTRLYALAGEVDDTLHAVERAWEQLPAPNGRRDRHSELLRAVVLLAEGSARLRGGDLDGACGALRHGSDVAAGAADDDLHRECAAMLALAEACRGRLAVGQEVVEEVARTGEVPVAAWLALGWVAIERQDLARGRDALASAGRLPMGCDDKLLESVSTLLRVRLLRDRGDIAGARHLLGGAEIPSNWLAPLIRFEAAAVGVPVDVADLRSALVGSVAERVHAALGEAQAHGLAGDIPGARSALADALSLAEADQLRRPFAQLRAETRAMLRNDRELQTKARWLRPDIADPSIRPVSDTEPTQIRVALSARELDVLHHLGNLLTTEEIAAQLFISTNTVRTHVRRILEKLSVSRRYEAVRRGRELGLV